MLLYVLGILSIATFGLSMMMDYPTESKLPITTCKRGLARDFIDYSTCLKDFLQEAWPQFVKGLPEFDFPILDPLLCEYDDRVVFNSTTVHGEIIYSNLTVIGLSNVHFTDVTTPFLDKIFALKIDMQVPNLYVKGTIKINAIIEGFRAVGEGQLTLSLGGVKGTWHFVGITVNDTWIVRHFYNEPSIKEFELKIDDLFKNKMLNDVFYAFLSEFWIEICARSRIIPFLSTKWDLKLIKSLNKIFSKVPFSKLFPVNIQ